MNKLINILLVILWMFLIFTFSSNNGDKSKSVSTEVIETTVSVFTDIEKNTTKMDKVVDTYTFPVRKCAHFFLYFILGILVINLIYSFKFKPYNIIIAVIICMLYAISDEIHQLFVGGRTFLISDIFLDTSASIFGSFFLNLYYIKRAKKKSL